MQKTILAAPALLLLMASCSEPTPKSSWKQMEVTYPETRTEDVTDIYFGTEVADPYRWLENDTSAETEAWVKAQNEVSFGFLEQIPFREALKTRYTELMNYPKVSAPSKAGDFFFIYKNDGLQDQSVIYYKEGEDGEERVFMDPNTMSKDGTVTVGLLGADDNNQYMAYLFNEAGSDWGEIRVRHIQSNQDTEDVLKWVKFSGAAWYKNGFFYSRYPEPSKGAELSAANEYHSVYYHTLGSPQSEDKLVYEDKKNARLYHNLGITEDKEYVILYVAQGTQNVDIHFRKTADEKGSFKPLITGFKAKSSVVDHKDGVFLMRTNYNAPNYRLVAISPENTDESNWKEILPETENLLSGVSKGGGYLFPSYMMNATSKVFRMQYDGSNRQEIELPGTGSAGGFSGKKDENKLYYSYTSFIYPSTIFEYDVESGQSREYYRPDLKFNPNDFEEKQVWYTSKDGTKVSMFVVHKKGLKMDGNNPTLLYAYGGFNISLTPSFSVSNILLLENGGVYALANLRGGGEYGEAWHQAGMLMNKQNVFDDFIAAGEYLISEKYTSSEKLAIAGGSNGGLLVGACMTQRPELFRVAFPAVGVLDMLRYHKFTVGWGWIPEYGSSEQSEEMFRYLYGYSPLHNLKKGTSYPATMITTADHDDRVVPAHSFKFAAALQAAHEGENPVLIRIDVNAGHGAGKPTSKIIEEQVDKWSFMLWNMGYDKLPQ